MVGGRSLRVCSTYTAVFLAKGSSVSLCVVLWSALLAVDAVCFIGLRPTTTKDASAVVIDVCDPVWYAVLPSVLHGVGAVGDWEPSGILTAERLAFDIDASEWSQTELSGEMSEISCSPGKVFGLGDSFGL